MVFFGYVWKLPLILRQTLSDLFSFLKWTWLWLIKLLEKWARKHIYHTPLDNWQVLVMKSCLQKECSGHSCECHVWSSSLCAYAFRIHETEESNNFKLLSEINVVCKDLGSFCNDNIHLLYCLDGKQSPASATYHSFNLWAKEKPGEILKLLP